MTTALSFSRRTGNRATARYLLPALAVLSILSGCDSQSDARTEAEAEADAGTATAVTADAAEPATDTASQGAAEDSTTAAGDSSHATQTLPELKLLPESSVSFTAEQIGVPLEGRFRTFTASVRLDPSRTDVETLAAAAIRLTVDTHSITVGVPDTDKELTGNAWFGRADGQQAVFVSSVVASPSPNTFEVTGMLTINGKSRALTTLATAEAQGEGRWLVTGSFPLQRLSFDIGTSPWDDTSVVADKVDVRYSLQFLQPQAETTQQPAQPEAAVGATNTNTDAGAGTADTENAATAEAHTTE